MRKRPERMDGQEVPIPLKKSKTYTLLFIKRPNKFLRNFLKLFFQLTLKLKLQM